MARTKNPRNKAVDTALTEITRITSQDPNWWTPGDLVEALYALYDAGQKDQKDSFTRKVDATYDKVARNLGLPPSSPG